MTSICRCWFSLSGKAVQNRKPWRQNWPLVHGKVGLVCADSDGILSWRRNGGTYLRVWERWQESPLGAWLLVSTVPIGCLLPYSTVRLPGNIQNSPWFICNSTSLFLGLTYISLCQKPVEEFHLQLTSYGVGTVGVSEMLGPRVNGVCSQGRWNYQINLWKKLFLHFFTGKNWVPH